MEIRMRQKTFIIALIVLLLSMLLPAFSLARTAVPEHTDSFYVNDFANVIDEKTENYIVNYGIRLHQQSGSQVVLVTVDSTNGAAIEEYATSLFNAWEVGSADNNKGVLLLFSIKDNEYWVVRGRGLEDELNDAVLSQILSQSLAPDFARKEYSFGARKTYGSLIQKLGGVWKEQVGSKTYVSDNAGVLKKVSKLYLNQSSNRFKTTTGSGIYVVTVKNSADKNLQEYTYSKFASIGAGSKDVMLVLDIGGDNYHILQGKDIDGMLTNEAMQDILDKVLEPEFARKNYASGAVATVNALHKFLLARADISQSSTLASSETIAVSSTAALQADKAMVVENQPVSISKGIIVSGLFLVFILLFSLAIVWRNRKIALYGYGSRKQRHG
ncbi:TPM domain-containing protein [Paenibacillus sp. FSL M7-1046]|uniref:TPM domain-containing protein n=1 Tax=Paenibacillus sp. FSL M7-1046 TaxID=2975315 RepID=UPI0030FC515D